MPLEQGSSRSVIAANIHEMMRNHSHAQAVAAALHTADQAHRMGGIIAHRDDGGVIGNSGVGGFAPSAQNQNPLMQGQIQRYASLPVEKLQELASMLGSSPQGQIVQHLLRQKQTQPNAQQQQAPQAAPQQSAPNLQPTQAQHRGGPVRRAMGGDMGVSPSQATPWWVKSEARTDTGTSPGSGFLSGNTPGRADALHTQAPAGSYILPADVVAGLGEGNSLAGARVVDEMLRTGPGGIPQAPAVRGRTMPQPPRAQAKGGGVQGKGATGKLTPVALSHGEYFVAPEHVMRIGGGNLKSGHRILDHWVQLERERQIKKLKALPPPVGAKKKEAA